MALDREPGGARGTGRVVSRYQPAERSADPRFLARLKQCRVDVVAEGHSPLRLVRADLFIVSLLVSVTMGLVWAFLQASGNSWTNVFLALYILATTVLFGSIPWSKFSHMFFKPAAAFQKRVEEANGSRNNLPAPADSPEIFGSNRRQPQNY